MGLTANMLGIVVLCAGAGTTLTAQILTTLHSFNGSDGQDPQAGLVKTTNGGFYGTTYSGGANNVGTIFRITPSGALTTLHSFCAVQNCADGELPAAPLVRATNGELYGATFGGGLFNYGTIFRITPSGSLTTLQNFCFQDKCGDRPYALIQANDGQFYGTTSSGGTNCPPSGCGTVFKIAPNGKLTTLHNFCVIQVGCADGSFPSAGLIQATDGNFYGTTSGGGQHNFGTVFKITPNGTLTTLYSFCSQSGCPDGLAPSGGVIQAADGNLYGTTPLGGAKFNSLGTVFKLSLNGTLTTLYSFCSQSACVDGGNPVAGLLQASDGNLYGTTSGGGANFATCVTLNASCGTVFKITPSGMLTTLYSFCSQAGCTDGSDPIGTLIQVHSGNLYGTTRWGGAYNDGTVFSLSLTLDPVPERHP